MTTEELAKHRSQVLDGIALNLRNIYLANVKAHCTKGKVRNAAVMELPPDERFMRLCEEKINIAEQACEGFRRVVWGGWQDGKNTGFLDTRLGPVFEQLASDYHAVNKALMVYTNMLDLS
jgi:hypothetical protein